MPISCNASNPGRRFAGLTLWLLIGLALACTAPRAQEVGSDDVIEQLQQLRVGAGSSADTVARLDAIQTRITQESPYPVQRELARTRMSVLEDQTPYVERLQAMQSLRDMAQINNDIDTVNLMDISRIQMIHADDDIGKYINQLNEVRTRITPDASVEVMEALERTYGNLYFDAGNFDTALRHQLAALDWADRLPRGRDRARLFRLATIAELYIAMDLPTQALEVVDEGLALDGGEKVPVGNRISFFATRSMALLKLSRLAEAETAFEQAEQLVGSGPTDFGTMRLLTLRAELWLAMSKPALAIKTIDQLATLAKQREDQYFIAKSRTLHGQALVRLGKVEQGLAEMRDANRYFESKGQMVDMLDGLDRQIDMLREMGLFQRAVATMEQRNVLWSQLFRNERGRAIAEVEARHTAEALERKITTLSAENRAAQASLRAEKLDKALVAALAALALSLSGYLFSSIRRARRERDLLSRAVRFDALTGAFSRYQFQRRNETVATRAGSPVRSSGLLLLDLDEFKAINDQHGHEAGDQVLRIVVERMGAALADGDEIYRWGGEEFLVVFNGSSSDENIDKVRRILNRVEREPVAWHDKSLQVGISGGFVQHPLAADWTTPLEDAVRWADAALYVAKTSGRGRVVQVDLADGGSVELRGHRPIDMAQLLDWQRHGHLELITISGESSRP